MWPILFTIGSVTIYTFGVLLGLGFFLASFLIWRRLRELGLKEDRTIDLLISLGLVGFLLSRLVYILWHFGQFGFFLDRWLLIRQYPGLSFWGGLLGVSLILARFSKKEKYSFWEIADEFLFGFLPFLILAQLACFFDGCVLGRPTSMPWGMFFPGSLLRRQPVSLFSAGLLLLIWIFLLWIERRWRMWAWYKSKAEGFIFLVFINLLLLINLGLAFWQDVPVYFLYLQLGLSSLGLLFFGSVFYRRSGRELSLRRKNDQRKKPKKK